MENWFNTAVGKGMNPDGAYGYQCKDVADDYCLHLFGDWVHTIKPGNAKDAFYNASEQYFTKVYNSPTGVPPRGAIICWNGNMGGGFGHIAVVSWADVTSFGVVEENGFTKTRPAYLAHYPNYSNVIGWLIPKTLDFEPVPAPVTVPAPIAPSAEPVMVVTPVPDSVPTPDPVQPILPAEGDLMKKLLTKLQALGQKLALSKWNSRKLIVSLSSAYAFFLAGQYTAAVGVVIAYLASQAHVDGKQNG